MPDVRVGVGAIFMSDKTMASTSYICVSGATAGTISGIGRGAGGQVVAGVVLNLVADQGAELA